MRKIEFCQYCGEKKRLAVNLFNGRYAVHCKHCGSIGPMAKDWEFAVLKWNDRIIEKPNIIPNATYNKMGCSIQG